MSNTPQIAEITLTHPELVLTETTTAVPEMRVILEYQTIATSGTYYLFFEVSGEDFPAFERAIDADPTITEWTTIVDGADFRVYRMLLASAEQLVLPKAAAIGLRVLHAEAGDGGWIGTLETPDSASLTEFRQLCADHGVTFRVNRLYHPTATERGETGAYGLTPVQLETLVTALEAGYFEEPRGASVEDLASQLSVSSSAVSGRLRRGLKSLLENTVGRK